MHEFATENVKLVGRYPISSAIGTRPDLNSGTGVSFPSPVVTQPPDVQPPKLNGDRLVIRATKVGPRRLQATPQQKCNMTMRTRRMTVQTSLSTNTSSSMTLLLPAQSPLGDFEPRSIKEAKSHHTWPHWKN